MPREQLYESSFIEWLLLNCTVKSHPIENYNWLSYKGKPYTVEGLYGEWKKEKKKLKV